MRKYTATIILALTAAVATAQDPPAATDVPQTQRCASYEENVVFTLISTVRMPNGKVYTRNMVRLTPDQAAAVERVLDESRKDCYK